MKWLTGLSILAAVVLGAQNFFLHWENQTLRATQSMANLQYGLLQDQLRDLESRLANNRTYDEGYVAAMLRSSNSEEYVSGYHAAMAQMFNTSMICDPKFDELKVKLQDKTMPETTAKVD